MFQDRLHNVLAVGDHVIYSEHETSQLLLGVIEGFTPKKVRVCRIYGDLSGSRSAPSIKESTRLLKVEIPDA